MRRARERRRGRKNVLRIRKYLTTQTNHNQTTMKTEACRARSLKSGKQTDEQYLAVRMTRSLSGVPRECRSLYGVRMGRKRLMGDFPVIAIRLAKHGAPPKDVLYPLHNVEREVMHIYGMTISASLADVQRDETIANGEFDQAQLEVAADPSNKSLIEKAIDAAYVQRIATELEIAKLDQMREGL